MSCSLPEYITNTLLLQAESGDHYSAQKSEYFCISRSKAEVTFDENREDVLDSVRRHVVNADDTAQDQIVLSCVLQRTRPEHTSCRPDHLPFQSAQTLREIFRCMRLPPAYLQIASGSPTTAHAFIHRDSIGQPKRFELVAYCTTKSGPWSLALSHLAATQRTSIFWSLGDRVDTESLLHSLTNLAPYAFHPMLVPCIMLEEILRTAVIRRHAIKQRLRELECAVENIGRLSSVDIKPGDLEAHHHSQPLDLQRLFDLVESCRNDQLSKAGRRDFWRSLSEAISEGFGYMQAVITQASQTDHLDAHSDLKQWHAVTWQKLTALLKEDKDHIQRVDNAAAKLNNKVQQQDIRLQSTIAKAMQRDSEDMKFIAILGSVFLPASLVATLLNVPEFQILRGGALFGAYIGISVPFVGLVVMLCITRFRWTRKRVHSARG